MQAACPEGGRGLPVLSHPCSVVFLSSLLLSPAPPLPPAWVSSAGCLHSKFSRSDSSPRHSALDLSCLEATGVFLVSAPHSLKTPVIPPHTCSSRGSFPKDPSVSHLGGSKTFPSQAHPCAAARPLLVTVHSPAGALSLSRASPFTSVLELEQTHLLWHLHLTFSCSFTRWSSVGKMVQAPSWTLLRKLPRLQHGVVWWDPGPSLGWGWWFLEPLHVTKLCGHHRLECPFPSQKGHPSSSGRRLIGLPHLHG